VIFEHLVKILAFKIRNPNTSNPKPDVLPIAKLPILTDVPSLSTAWMVIMLVLHF